jgi:uncharacterized membrane protein (UPF0127 family)
VTIGGRGRRHRLARAVDRLGDLESHETTDGLRVFEARRWAERRDGLADLDDLPAEWGLHIRRCRAVHMHGMRFPLDLVWLDRAGTVVKVSEDVRPGRYAACLRASSVVEVRAGQGARFAAAIDDAGDRRAVR